MLGTGLRENWGFSNMKKLARLAGPVALATGMIFGAVQPASAGDYNGDFMVRLQGTYLLTDDEMKSINSTAAGDISGLANTETTNSWLPTATLSYFFNDNLAVELFCCFAMSGIEINDTGLGAALGGGPIDGEAGRAWMFPPALTLQYHVTSLGRFKPYVGAGVQWIHFFDEELADNVTGASKIEVDDAFGFVLQAGMDVELGGGWYFNADVKKSFLDTEVTLHDVAGVAGHTVTVDHDLDPWVFSVGVGYRFDLFGRSAALEPLK